MRENRLLYIFLISAVSSISLWLLFSYITRASIVTFEFSLVSGKSVFLKTKYEWDIKFSLSRNFFQTWKQKRVLEVIFKTEDSEILYVFPDQKSYYLNIPHDIQVLDFVDGVERIKFNQGAEIFTLSFYEETGSPFLSVSDCGSKHPLILYPVKKTYRLRTDSPQK